jgi:hypothetical protein
VSRAKAALKSLPIIASVLAAAGCANRSDLGMATLMSEVPPTQAAIVPPPGGPSVVAVLQRRYQNGLTQEVALSTASATTGQNAFYISLVKEPETVSEIDDTLGSPRLNQEVVQKEMEQRVPGVDMRTSLLYAQNKYGPFGFAVGRSSTGDNCLYAWQQIEPKEPVYFIPGGAISVRLRLCDADATEAQLLRSMYGFTIPAYYMNGEWNPYGTPPSPPAHLGETDAPIFPLGLGAGETTVSRPQTGTRRPVIRTDEEATGFVDKDTVLPSDAVPTAPAVPAPPAIPGTPLTPLEGYPVVPPPPAP